jgi:hypothetical protein
MDEESSATMIHRSRGGKVSWGKPVLYMPG